MKRKKTKKVPYSLFSVRTVLFLFIAVSFAITYIVEIVLHTAKVYKDNELLISNWSVGIIAYLTLCIVLTAIILIYRHFTVKNPIMRILAATDKIGEGDFSVKLPVKHKKRFKNEYDVISENINTMAQELSAIETLRNDFVSNVSHEFKAPLALIQNSCTILSDEGLSSEDRKRYTDDISEATKRLAAMVTNILKLNKIENLKIGNKREKINLTEQLREEILVFEYLWTAKNIDVDFDSDEDIYIFSDREMMSLMWTNILSNAFKFTPEGGCVEITAVRKADCTTVTISDTGDGIPEDKLPRIFEKFYQVDSSHITEGNGLGLALVKSICDTYGYSIDIGNNEAGGCIVRVVV